MRLLARIVPNVPDRLADWALRVIARSPALSRWFSKSLINHFASAAPARPQPLSLAVDGYTSWVTLTDASYSSRYLPPCSDRYAASLPGEDAIVDLLMRPRGQEQQLARKTSLLFPFFAQWFTDSFLRTHPSSFRRNQSNHGIDLCQIYGTGEPKTLMLRAMEGGRLKSQDIGGEEYGVFLFEPGADGKPVLRPEFHGLYSEENFARTLGVGSRLTDEQRLRCFAVGLEHGNSTLGNVVMNTLFLRQHNRLARLLERHNPGWDDERIFQTARLVNTAILLRIVVEDYIVHISGYDMPLTVQPGFPESEDWYRTNWMAVEFNLLYRWHGLIPDRFAIAGQELGSERMVDANDLLLAHGLDRIVQDASRQKAGRIGLGHTPWFLREVKKRTVALARGAKLQPYNEYRKHFSLRPLASFEELTRDPAVAAKLAQHYASVDEVELVVGLLAEGHDERNIMGQLQLTMVAHEAFTHALTNPLLAKRVFTAETFTAEGLREIQAMGTLADVVVANTCITDRSRVSFTYTGKEAPRAVGGRRAPVQTRKPRASAAEHDWPVSGAEGSHG
jgi:prostaglandin-endoperoxide synthase 2